MSDIADIIGAFDSEEHAKPSYEALPAGWYDVVIDQAEIKDTKAGTGKYLKVVFKLTGSDYGERLLFTNINLMNPNAKAEEIGRRELGNLGSAVGVKAVRDTTDFLGKVLQVKVVVEQEDGREPGNVVKGYRSGYTSAVLTKVSVAPVAKTTVAPVAKTDAVKRPWEK